MVAVTPVDASPVGQAPRPGWSLALRGVNRERAGAPILRDIDLDVAPGTIVALVGPSGCGASTLLRVASGAERVDAGSVIVEGRSGAAAPRIPAVLVRTPVARFGRVRAAVLAAARQAGCDSPGAETDRLLDLVGLGAGDKSVHRLSHGDRQRWALARALAAQPRALVLDDALAALHTTARAETRDRLVRELRERGVTTLWATRDTAEAAAVADHLVVMDQGRIVAAGCPDEVYARVSDAAVAEVLGPVSAVPGIVEGHTVEVWGQELPLAEAAHDGHCEVVVRPENVLLVGPDSPGVDGVVEDSIFLGSVRRSTVLTSDGSRVVVEHTPDQRLGDRDAVRLALAVVPATVRPID
ncbi:ATP-binding cassette domain-containing protein [Microbacterium testaceum]|uniref:ATP-binding cassette domain-containing protein n=1 Tax=Microbacterium testaceum TaxID=2033 RepID=UPI0012469F79|nr:ATP-binding cassette domain-containing protein [Microbacterium testaceum]